MNNKAIIAIVAVVLLAGGGYWYYTSTKSDKMSDVQNQAGMMDADHNPVDATSTTTHSGSDMMSSSTPTTSGNVKEFVVSGDNFTFAPKVLSVKKGDTVKIVFKNTGGFHDLKIDEFNVATPQIQGGAEASIEFVADKAGSFQYYCSVGKHRSMGMWGTLTVTE